MFHFSNFEKEPYSDSFIWYYVKKEFHLLCHERGKNDGHFMLAVSMQYLIKYSYFSKWKFLYIHTIYVHK